MASYRSSCSQTNMEGKSFNAGRSAGSRLSCCQLDATSWKMTMTNKIRRPVRFTADTLLRVRQMAAEGNSSIEIAKFMGSTSASVKNVCSRHKIKIPRRHRLSKLVAYLPASISTELHRKAVDFQTSASKLASRLLAAIVASNIYEAVLDDKD